MSLKKEESGRRSIQVEVEVPGAPEEVWQAIATGPGVSSWFVPTKVEERTGGTIVSTFAPGMEGKATITEWQPPERFAAESRNLGPNAPVLATEWTVEASAGGTCVVRVVHSLFSDTGDWDNQLTSIESGWPAYFSVLKLSLAHFRGQSYTDLCLPGPAPAPFAKAWPAIQDALGLVGVDRGGPWKTPARSLPMSGVLERLETSAHGAHVLLRLESPAPGILSLLISPGGDKTYVYPSVFFYGEGSRTAAAEFEASWRKWFDEWSTVLTSEIGVANSDN